MTTDPVNAAGFAVFCAIMAVAVYLSFRRP